MTNDSSLNILNSTQHSEITNLRKKNCVVCLRCNPIWTIIIRYNNHASAMISIFTKFSVQSIAYTLTLRWKLSPGNKIFVFVNGESRMDHSIWVLYQHIISNYRRGRENFPLQPIMRHFRITAEKLFTCLHTTTSIIHLSSFSIIQILKALQPFKNSLAIRWFLVGMRVSVWLSHITSD